MSLRPAPIDPIPEETARVARVAFPRGNRCLLMRDTLGACFTDAAFADLFAARGQPALAPWRLALATLLQYVEGLSDAQAAEAVRGRIDWKYALSLPLTDPGFDSGVLSEFRSRLVAGGAEGRVFTLLLACLAERQLLKAHGRQRTASTHVLAAVGGLNRLDLAREALRAALEGLADAAPDWLRARADPAWAERYELRTGAWRLPGGAAARGELAGQVGADGWASLEATAAAGLRAVPAVEVLRRVWVQNYYRDDAGLHWRAEDQVPPADVAIRSPYDPDARAAQKRATAWTGYKVHLTETCEPDAPRLITQVETTVAPCPDSAALPAIQADLAARHLQPRTHLADGGYVDADGLVRSREAYGVDLPGPAPPDTSWQARAGQGFAAEDFAVDWAARRVTCPAGRPRVGWRATEGRYGTAVIEVKFARAACGPCPVRPRCTRAADARRTLTLRPRAQQEALQQARARQGTAAFAAAYAQRAGIEGTLAQGVRAFGLRHARYLGRAKAHLQHLLTAAALNFVRAAAWLAGATPATTRQSAFARLMLSPAPC